MDIIERFYNDFGPEVKSREGTNLRFKCPSCGHNSLSASFTKGKINCFACSYGKGISYEVDDVIVPEEVPIDNKLHYEVTQEVVRLCSLNDLHKSYLLDRGICKPESFLIKSVPVSVLEKLLLKFTQDDLINSGYARVVDGILRECLALAPRRILIPYWQGDKIVSIKTRARLNSSDVKYLSPRGSRVGSNIWFKDLFGSDLIITEGEFAAIKTIEEGICTVSIPGLGSVTNKSVIAQLKSISSSFKRVFIILDSDEGIQNDTYKLANCYKLCNSLSNSCITYLPQENNMPIDLDEFLNMYSYDDLYEILDYNWPRRNQIKNFIKKKIK